MIKIYHNNRCSKSRCGLEILEKSGKDFEIVKYLEDTLSEKALKDIMRPLKKGYKFWLGLIFNNFR